MSEMIYLKNIPPASAVMWHQAQTTWSHSKDGHWGRCQILKGWCECHMPQCPPKNRTGVQQIDIKTSIRFLEQKSRPFKGSSSAGSWGHKGGASLGALWLAQRLLAQVQGEAQDGGGGRLSPPLTRLTLSWVWLWSQVRDVLTLSQPLGYFLRWRQNTGSSSKFSVVRTLMRK